MSNLKILIADDHDLVRKGFRMLIEEHPRLDRLRRSPFGVEQATQHTPDVVVIDVSMPDLNGLEAGALLPPLPLPVNACLGRSSLSSLL